MSQVLPWVDFARPAPMGLAHKAPDASKAPLGLTMTKTTFRLVKQEPGPKGIIYAEYREV